MSVDKNRAFIQSAQELIDLWKSILGMDPWTITVETRDALRGGETIRDAEVDITWEGECAVITFLADECLGQKSEDDMEKIIVHELFHCLLFPFEPPEQDEVAWLLYEQCIDRLARSMVSLHRPGKRSR